MMLSKKSGLVVYCVIRRLILAIFFSYMEHLPTVLYSTVPVAAAAVRKVYQIPSFFSRRAHANAVMAAKFYGANLFVRRESFVRYWYSSTVAR